MRKLLLAAGFIAIAERGVAQPQPQPCADVGGPPSMQFCTSFPGPVGVMLPNPQTQLEVNGQGIFSQPSGSVDSAGFYIWQKDVPNKQGMWAVVSRNARHLSLWNFAGGDVLALLPTGQVGVGTLAPSLSDKLTVNGAVNVGGTQVINASGQWVGPATNLQGATGPTGPTGPPAAGGGPGSPGDVGPRGPTGATGTAGNPGNPGATGTMGSEGTAPGLVAVCATVPSSGTTCSGLCSGGVVVSQSGGSAFCTAQTPENGSCNSGTPGFNHVSRCCVCRF